MGCGCDFCVIKIGMLTIWDELSKTQDELQPKTHYELVFPWGYVFLHDTSFFFFYKSKFQAILIFPLGLKFSRTFAQHLWCIDEMWRNWAKATLYFLTKKLGVFPILYFLSQSWDIYSLQVLFLNYFYLDGLYIKQISIWEFQMELIWKMIYNAIHLSYEWEIISRQQSIHSRKLLLVAS